MCVAWVTVDKRLLCHAASQQGAMILFKAVETAQAATLPNPKIKEECRWCVCVCVCAGGMWKIVKIRLNV